MQFRGFRMVTRVFSSVLIHRRPQSNRCRPPRIVPKGGSGAGGRPRYDLPIAMTTADPPAPENGNETEAGAGAGHGAEPVDRVAALRGAGVGGVDARRVGRILVGLVLATLAVLVVVFTVVGVHHNQQDDRLHDDGVPVTFTVSGCLGLLGGSGSNAAGYSCRGSYPRRPPLRLRLPGNDFHRPGSTVYALAVPGDPALVHRSPSSRPRIVGERLPPSGLLLVILVLMVALLLGMRRGAASTRRTRPNPRHLSRAGTTGARGVGGWRVAFVGARPRTLGGPGVPLGAPGPPRLGPLERLLQPISPDQVPRPGQQEWDAETPETKVEDGQSVQHHRDPLEEPLAQPEETRMRTARPRIT